MKSDIPKAMVPFVPLPHQLHHMTVHQVLKTCLDAAKILQVSIETCIKRCNKELQKACFSRLLKFGISKKCKKVKKEEQELREKEEESNNNFLKKVCL